MNIFVLSTDPVKAAEMHCDKHCIKMILESCQILSVAARLNGSTNPALYKVSHANHPCSKWARESRSNYLWLCELAKNLVLEYELRYGKNTHKSKPVLEQCILEAKRIPKGPITKRPVCMPDYCKTDSVVQSYRNYYIHEKARFATWKTKAPSWFISGINTVNQSNA